MRKPVRRFRFIPAKRRNLHHPRRSAMKTVTERASAYLARMPASVSGQRGHAAAFSAAVALVRGFDLSEEEALPLLSRWNDACRPPWKENELRHKLRSAASAAGRPAGICCLSPLHLSKYHILPYTPPQKTVPGCERRGRNPPLSPMRTCGPWQSCAASTRTRWISPTATDFSAWRRWRGTGASSSRRTLLRRCAGWTDSRW
jgi:hypothetical protein